MRKIVFILVIISIFLSACERKSGRKISTNSNHPSKLQNLPLQKQESRTVSPLSTKKMDRKLLTGSQIFEKYNSAVFMVFTSDGFNVFQGSGFFISERGLAVSNYHVFKGTDIGYERIRLSNGKVYQLQNVIAQSEDNDFILFEIASNGDKFNYIPITQSVPKVGESTYAIGSPRGLENTFSSGEISQLRGDNIIQINVPIDHGSSGGALINAYGEAIGITTAGFDDSGANLNFAIDIKVINSYLVK